MKKPFAFPFMKYRKFFIALACVMAVTGALLVLCIGFNKGIDFTGGNLLQVEFSDPISVGAVRAELAKEGYARATIQAFSDRGVNIRFQGTEEGADDQALRDSLMAALDKIQAGKVKLLSFEMVGPTVGGELTHQAVLATTLALIGILIYVAFRFQFRFAVVSVLALVHDTMIVLGFFCLFHREIALPFIAAILTTVGYSLNDTIVIMDRVRENWKQRRTIGMAALMDNSINQTLGRTVNTTVTTFMPVLAFYLLGGPVLANFSLALMIGIIAGTFSSLCFTTSALVFWYDKYPVKDS